MGIPVLANSETARGICSALHDHPKFKLFSTGESFTFGDLHIHPFSIQHDTLDPVAFTINIGNLKIGFCTDLGFVTSLVKTHLKECNYLYVEANHQPSMVHASSRPYVNKQRVLGRCGHLSNQSCAELIEEVIHPNLKHIHLAHLSEECNHPEIALSTVKEVVYKIQPVNISIAPQHFLGEPIHF